MWYSYGNGRIDLDTCRITMHHYDIHYTTGLTAIARYNTDIVAQYLCVTSIGAASDDMYEVDIGCGHRS